MERQITFTYSPEELYSIIKSAVQEALSSQETITYANSPPISSPLDILSATEVCKVLHISRPTLIKYSNQKILVGKKVRGKIYYQKSAIEQFLSIKQGNKKGML
jgi:hypothetical protein